MHKSAFFKENHFSLIGGLFVLFRMDFFSIPAINEAYANIRVSSRFFVQAGHETKYASSRNHHFFQVVYQVIVRPTKIMN